jgi:hypothetical protein
MPVCYSVLFQTDWYMEGEVLKLSASGCAIETWRCLMYGEYVRLQIVLPRSIALLSVMAFGEQ